MCFTYSLPKKSSAPKTEVWRGSQRSGAEDPPGPLVRLYHVPAGTGFAATPGGWVSGPPEALEFVRFGNGLALYDLIDVPERLSPERVAAALHPQRTRA